MSKRHAPSVTSSPQALAQQEQGQEQSEEMVQAGQVGNAAMQERAQQGGGMESEGLLDEAMEGVEGAIDAVIDWTWEQIGSADDLLTYAAEAGMEAALAMVQELAAYVPTVLEELMAAATEVDELAWAAFEALGHVSVLMMLPGTTQALFLAEALLRGTGWVIEQLIELDPVSLKGLLLQLADSDFDALLSHGEALFLAALDAAWEAGLGITVALEAEAEFGVVGAGMGGELTVRHLGQGAFEVERTLTAGMSLGRDLEPEVGEAELVLGLEGWLRENYELPWSGLSTPLDVLRAGLGIFGAIQSTILGALGHENVFSYLQEFELGGGAYVRGGAKGEAEAKDAMSFALAMGAAAGVEGRLVVSAIDDNAVHIALSASSEVLIEAGASADLAGAIETAIGSVDNDKGAGGTFTLEADMRVDPETQAPVLEGLTVTHMAESDMGDTELAVGVELDAEQMPESVEQFLQQMVSLKIEAHIGAAGDEAQAWLKQADLLGSLGGGAWSLSAEATLEAEIDADAAMFIAQVVVETLMSELQPDNVLEELMRWAASPLAYTPPAALELLATELCLATNLSLTLKGEASQEASGGEGFEGSAEVRLDIEKDLLDMGAVVTVDQVREVLTGKVSGHDLQLA